MTELARNTGLAPFGSPSLAQAPRIFERAVVAALADAQGERSIAFNLASLERAAGALRDRLSPEHWRLVRKAREPRGETLTPRCCLEALANHGKRRWISRCSPWRGNC